MDATTLSIASSFLPLRSATIDPVVLLAILDHHTRRHDDHPFVVGALLGNISDAGHVDVRTSLPLVHTFTSTNVIEMNAEFQQVLYDLHRKVSTRDHLIGWYASCGTLPPGLLQLAQRFGDVLIQPEAIFLTVNTDLSAESALALNAFSSIPLLSGALCGTLVQPLACTLRLSSGVETIGWDMVRRAREQNQSEKNVLQHSTTLLPSAMDELERQLTSLCTMLADLEKMVVSCENKTSSLSSSQAATLGRSLLDLFSSLAWMESGALESAFHGHLQDMLMVVYLANLTKAQLALADKLQYSMRMIV
jgi:translation initiation factor 3 subunit F